MILIVSFQVTSYRMSSPFIIHTFFPQAFHSDAAIQDNHIVRLRIITLPHLSLNGAKVLPPKRCSSSSIINMSTSIPSSSSCLLLFDDFHDELAVVVMFSLFSVADLTIL